MLEYCLEVFIMNGVSTYRTNQPELGLFFRKSTTGKELDLVEEFVDEYQKEFLRYNKKKSLAIFIEPRLESGFPDIVFAKYQPDFVYNWNSKRSELDEQTLKILSLLISFKGLSSKKISRFGFSDEEILISIEKLLDAELITRVNEMWKSKNFKEICGITELIAVEAKMANNSKVLEQAITNTWFSSESYTLINSINPNKKTIESYNSKGIGMYGKKERFSKLIKAKKNSLPTSYITLQFNEWIGNQNN